MKITPSFTKIVLINVNPVDALFMKPPYPWRKPPAKHGKGGKVVFGISMGIGIVFLQRQIAFVVEQAIQHNLHKWIVFAFSTGSLSSHQIVGAMLLNPLFLPAPEPGNQGLRRITLPILFLSDPPL